MINNPSLIPYQEKYESLLHQPFEVILTLQTGHIGYDALMLDALLSHAVVDEATGGRGLPQSAEPYDLPLPLRCLWRSPVQGLPLWSSTAFFPMESNQTESAFWHKRAIRPEMVKRSKKGTLNLLLQKGVDKEYRIPMPRHTSLVWRATADGNIDEVARLLGKINSIGKKRSIGYGIVDSWQIAQIPDFSLFDLEGHLLRPVPAGYLQKMPFDLQYCGWTPPYWLAACMIMCVPIGVGL